MWVQVRIFFFSKCPFLAIMLPVSTHAYKQSEKSMISIKKKIMDYYKVNMISPFFWGGGFRIMVISFKLFLSSFIYRFPFFWNWQLLKTCQIIADRVNTSGQGQAKVSSHWIIFISNILGHDWLQSKIYMTFNYQPTYLCRNY